jgi:uncharacterized protein (TIGR02284 family)
MAGKEELVGKLKHLMQLDFDATRAYQQAIDRIDPSDEDIKAQLKIYQQDHEAHVQKLSKLIGDLGETPPKQSPDLKGFVLQGFTAIRSMSGTEGAIKAMESNEKMTNKEYSDAHMMDMPPEIKSLIDENYGDEQRHLHYIREVLSTHAWQK